MTKDDWAQVEEALKHQFNPVTLVCDGYRLQLQLSQVKAMSLGITCYVNGWMRGEWLITDCEERRRFVSPRVIPVYNEKRRQIYKGISAKSLKEYGIDLKKTFIGYSYYWGSYRALKAHLIKYNQSIELFPSQAAAIPVPGGHLEI